KRRGRPGPSLECSTTPRPPPGNLGFPDLDDFSRRIPPLERTICGPRLGCRAARGPAPGRTIVRNRPPSGSLATPSTSPGPQSSPSSLLTGSAPNQELATPTIDTAGPTAGPI